MEDYDRTMIGGGQSPASGLELPPTLRISMSFINGPLEGERIRLTKTVMTVGRKTPAEIVVPDPTVSGSHARFEIAEGVVTLIDCQSTNGTFVSGNKVSESTVNNMDEVGFGDTRALLTIVNDPYGLYGDDLGAEEGVAERTSVSVSAPPFENCLLAGYVPARKSIIEPLVESKSLAKEFVSVNHGGEFVQAAAMGFRDGKPLDLIITEIRMPLLNGIQSSVAFRNMEKVYGVQNPAPVVIFSEVAPDVNVRKAVEYLKPAKFFQAVADPAEFQRRSEALIERLRQLGYSRKS